MRKIKHFAKRMSQRGINQELVNCILKFGTKYYDGKVRLDRQGIKRSVATLDKLRKQLLIAEKKGGLVVVEEDEVLITTYGLHK